MGPERWGWFRVAELGLRIWCNPLRVGRDTEAIRENFRGSDEGGVPSD